MSRECVRDESFDLENEHVTHCPDCEESYGSEEQGYDDYECPECGGHDMYPISARAVRP